MKGIINGKIFWNAQFIENKVLLYEDKVIDILDQEKIDLSQLEKVIDAKGHMVLPGFIDLHIHGYAGYDTMDESDQALKIVSQRILENGVTSFLPTTMTMERSTIQSTLRKLQQLKDNNSEGAAILGFHLEGPFINTAFKGAQNGEDVLEPDLELIEEFRGLIKIVTLAPELPGAMALIKELTNRNIVASLGHTGADYETALHAFEQGARGITHIFNAMTGLNHRRPGVVGAALIKDFYCEIIADNIHLHPAIYEILLKIKKLENIILVTDSTSATGMPDGIYELGGQKVNLLKGKCCLEDGTIAGSVLRMNIALKNFTESSKLPLEKAILLITENPARYMGVSHQRGSLSAGMYADITIMDKNFVIHHTIKEGSHLYAKKARDKI